MLRKSGFALLLLLLSPATTSAHKMWLLPSETVLNGPQPLITVDGAISNDLFYFNHHALPLASLAITAPDGTNAAPENQATLRYRSVFDVALPQKGTYRISAPMSGLFATWEEGGERRFWRGSKDDFAAKVPGGAANLQVTESVIRVETFVSNGTPSTGAFQVVGKGIELVPVTHPNDLYAGESARFKLLVDGKPAVGLEVEVVRGGTRYRNAQEEIHAKTDEQGEVVVPLAEPGMYWLEATTSDDKMEFPSAHRRSLTYTATLEVLPR